MYIIKQTKMADLIMTYPLHECVFRNDIRQLSSLLRTSDISQKDKYGKQSKKKFHCKEIFFPFFKSIFPG